MVKMDEIRSRAVRPSEIERLYGLSHATLWRMMREGNFPVYRAGRVVRIPLKEFEAWFEAQEREGEKWRKSVPE